MMKLRYKLYVVEGDIHFPPPGQECNHALPSQEAAAEAKENSDGNGYKGSSDELCSGNFLQ